MVSLSNADAPGGCHPTTPSRRGRAPAPWAKMTSVVLAHAAPDAACSGDRTAFAGETYGGQGARRDHANPTPVNWTQRAMCNVLFAVVTSLMVGVYCYAMTRFLPPLRDEPPTFL